MPENLPAMQSKHTAEELAPTVLEYLPALHCIHVENPSRENVPEPQSKHIVDDDAPLMLEYFPAIHMKQLPDKAGKSPYFPGSHSEH